MRIKPTTVTLLFAAMLMFGASLPSPAQADGRFYRQAPPVHLYGAYNRHNRGYSQINRYGNYPAHYRARQHSRYGHGYRYGNNINHGWIASYTHWPYLIRGHEDCDED